MPLLSRLLPAAALALVTLVVLWPVGRNGFISFDDEVYVMDNLMVRRGLTPEGVRWAFTTFHGSNWHPLTWISHMLDVSLFGLDPGGHHLAGLLLHTANAVLLFIVLRALTGAAAPGLFAAALFALHPLHVESVAWAAERKDLLSTLFWILTMGAYLRYLRRPSPGRYALAVGLFALGLTAKPMLVTLPFVLLLLDGWPLNRWRPVPGQGGGHPWPLGRFPGSTSPRGGAGTAVRLVLEKAPLLLLSAASSAVTFYAQRASGAMAEMDDLAPGRRAANALVSAAVYIGKMLWPRRLAVFYPYPTQGPGWLPAVLALALLAAVSLAVLAAHRRFPYLAVGWLWYLVTLAPVIGLVQVGSQAMADRYTYVPLTGLFIAAAWGGANLASRYPRLRVPLAAAALAVLALLAPVARRQAGYWRDNLTLFGHAVDVTKNNWLAQNSLGTAQAEAGRIGEARGHFEAALAVKPEYPKALMNLGNVLAQEGRLIEAIDHYRAALELDPAEAGAHYNLGLLLLQHGRIPEAAEHFREAIRIKPRYGLAHGNLGVILAGQGRLEEAVGHFRAAIEANPGDADAHHNLGLALSSLGRDAEAGACFAEARRLGGGAPP